jgi:hypothetical protein
LLRTALLISVECELQGRGLALGGLGTTPLANELVDRRKWYQKMTGAQDPITQAKQVAAQKQAQQAKDLEDLF